MNPYNDNFNGRDSDAPPNNHFGIVVESHRDELDSFEYENSLMSQERNEDEIMQSPVKREEDGDLDADEPMKDSSLVAVASRPSSRSNQGSDGVLIVVEEEAGNPLPSSSASIIGAPEEPIVPLVPVNGRLSKALLNSAEDVPHSDDPSAGRVVFKRPFPSMKAAPDAFDPDVRAKRLFIERGTASVLRSQDEVDRFDKLLTGEMSFAQFQALTPTETSNEYYITIKSPTVELSQVLKPHIEMCSRVEDEIVKLIRCCAKTGDGGSLEVMLIIHCWMPVTAKALAAHLGLDKLSERMAMKWDVMSTHNVQLKKLIEKVTLRDGEWAYCNYGISLPLTDTARYMAMLHGIEKLGWDYEYCRKICPVTTSRHRQELIAAVSEADPPGYQRKSVRVIVLYGPKRTGKTTFVMDRHGEDNVYTQCTSSQFFDGYKGGRHNVILVDEIYKIGGKRLEPGLVMKMAEKRRLRLNRKFGSSVCTAKVMYFVSNFHPSTWFEDQRSYDIFMSRCHWIGESTTLNGPINWTKGEELLREEAKFGFDEPFPTADPVSPDYPPIFE